MKRWKVILAACLIFATGVATGALSSQVFHRSSVTATRDNRVPFGMMDARFDLLGKMKRDLSISEDQARRIDLLLQEGRKRMRTVWESFQPTMREESKSVHDRIEAELTEAQRVQWEAMLKKSRERRGPRPEGDKDKDKGSKANGRRGERGSNQPPANPTADQAISQPAR